MTVNTSVGSVTVFEFRKHPSEKFIKIDTDCGFVDECVEFISNDCEFDNAIASVKNYESCQRIRQRLSAHLNKNYIGTYTVASWNPNMGGLFIFISFEHEYDRTLWHIQA